jgi:glutathione synthase/RimK-type ligase-like ATP-grasp enzyme
MRNVIVASHKSQWPLSVEGVEVITPREYLTGKSYAECTSMRVFNLCRSYRYQTVGYYVSLLAEARGHRVMPDVTTLQDCRFQTLTRAVADDVEELIQHSLRHVHGSRFELNIYFGEATIPRYRQLAHRLYSLFEAPLLKVTFEKTDEWTIQQVSPLPFTRVLPDDHPMVLAFAEKFFSKKTLRRNRQHHYPYDLAILVNPQETAPPSDKDALQEFVQAANRAGFNAELITREDYSRLAEFDALLIRETTAVNHHTYRFARRAHAEGLIVVDDPWSILRCTNKVYLAEMLARAKIPCPKTIVLHSSDGVQRIVDRWQLGYPSVLKQPDSAFSLGVKKVKSPEQLAVVLHEFFETSDLVIAQEFVESQFDWRVGVLGRKPLYACKYYMAKGHWQIYNWQEATAGNQSGKYETLAVEDVPPKVIEMAVRASSAVGDGFYGVDLKQIGDRVVVIEVNDNPSIDHEVEDLVLGDALYDRIMRFFRQKIEEARSPASANGERKTGLRQALAIANGTSHSGVGVAPGTALPVDFSGMPQPESEIGAVRRR